MPTAWKRSAISREHGAPEIPAQPACSRPVASRSGAQQRVVDPRLAVAHALERRRRAPRCVRVVADVLEHRHLDLLVDPRDAEEPRRADLEQRLLELPGVDQRRDRHAGAERRVVADLALGDVRHRQVGDVAAADTPAAAGRRTRRRRTSARCAGTGRPWARRSCRTCRRASAGRRARRPRRSRRRRTAPAASNRRSCPITTSLICGRSATSSRARSANCASAITNGRLGVVDVDQQLLDRRGVVERERRGAEQHGAHVDDVELEPVREQQRDAVAALDAELREPAGHGAGARQPLVDR